MAIKASRGKRKNNNVITEYFGNVSSPKKRFVLKDRGTNLSLAEVLTFMDGPK